MLKKNEIFEVLDFWNFWNKNLEKNFKRESYEKRIKLFKKSKETIAIKGIRRCGKSTLLKLEIQNLLDNGVLKNQILFVNFEEPKFMNFLEIDLLDKIYETYLFYLKPNENKKIFLFLDEIQNIVGFEKWINKMKQNKNIEIFITGSSSKLLSNEFSTILSGRFLQIEVFPLSFVEFLSFKKIDSSNEVDIIRNKIKIKREFDSYIKEGGFPKLIELKTQELKKEEIYNYFLTIILKDISQRYNLSNFYDLKNLAMYFFSNNSKLYSVNNLKNLKMGSYDTIKKYIEYFKEVYLFFTINKFDYSLKKQILSEKKIYTIDTGFVNYLSFKFSEDFGRQLENIVFLHFKRQTIYEIFYHKNKFECDFLLKEKDKIVKAVQVTKSLNYENEKREVMGLVEAALEHDLKEGLILTYEDDEREFVKDKIKIKVRQLWKYLIEK